MLKKCDKISYKLYYYRFKAEDMRLLIIGWITIIITIIIILIII